MTEKEGEIRAALVIVDTMEEVRKIVGAIGERNLATIHELLALSKRLKSHMGTEEEEQ